MQEDEDSDDMDDVDDSSMNNGDFEKKAATAEDFSDINELAEDLQVRRACIALHGIQFAREMIDVAQFIPYRLQIMLISMTSRMQFRLVP